MKTKKEYQQLAGRLVKISLTKDGAIDDERVLAIIEELKKQYEFGLLPILKAYQKELERYSRMHTAIIESAVPLTQEQQEHLVQKMALENQSMMIENIVNPKLIAGVRVTLGDTIYERSAANNFAQIKESV